MRKSLGIWFNKSVWVDSNAIGNEISWSALASEDYKYLQILLEIRIRSQGKIVSSCDSNYPIHTIVYSLLFYNQYYSKKCEANYF